MHDSTEFTDLVFENLSLLSKTKDICYPTSLRISLVGGGGADLIHAAAAAKSLQSCPTLCDPIDGSPPGSSVPGILQARRILECVAISFSNA